MARLARGQLQRMGFGCKHGLLLVSPPALPGLVHWPCPGHARPLPIPPLPAGFGELAYRQGTQKTLIGLCVCMFAGLCCTWFVPETKGKTLEQIWAERDGMVSPYGSVFVGKPRICVCKRLCVLVGDPGCGSNQRNKAAGWCRPTPPLNTKD